MNIFQVPSQSGILISHIEFMHENPLFKTHEGVVEEFPSDLCDYKTVHKVIWEDTMRQYINTCHCTQSSPCLGSTTSSDPVHGNPTNWKASKSWPASQHSASSPVLQAQPPALTLPKAVVIHMKPSVLLGWMCTPSFSSQNCKKPYSMHGNPLFKTRRFCKIVS